MAGISTSRVRIAITGRSSRVNGHHVGMRTSSRRDIAGIRTSSCRDIPGIRTALMLLTPINKLIVIIGPEDIVLGKRMSSYPVSINGEKELVLGPSCPRTSCHAEAIVSPIASYPWNKKQLESEYHRAFLACLNRLTD